MKQKFAIFDVDKTVIRTDSMFQFLIYGWKKRPSSAPHLFKVALHSALYKAG